MSKQQTKPTGGKSRPTKVLKHWKSEESRDKARGKVTKRVTILPTLPRPRKALLASTQPSTIDDGEELSSTQRLRRTVALLQQIYVRNKNQHRGQVWFKQLNVLRRAVRSLLDLYVQLEKLQSHRAEGVNAQDIRKRFEREAKLRGEKERLEEWIREVLVPEAYVAFSGLVADNQFAHVGVVLVGLVGDVGGVVGHLKNNLATEEGVVGVKEIVGRREVVTGRKKGEVEEVGYELGDQGLQLAGVGHAEEMDLGEVIERKEMEMNDSGEGEPEAVQSSAPREVQMKLEDDGPEIAAENIETSMREGGAGRDQRIEEKEGAGKGKNYGRSKDKKTARKKKNAIDDIFAGF